MRSVPVKRRRRALASLAVFALCFALCFAFGQQAIAADADSDYPSRTITIVVPFAAGGAGDLTTRVFAQKLAQVVSHPVIVLNRPGAGFVNSATMVAHARPDGYTVFLSGNGADISSVLFRNLPYKLSDFRHVSSVAFFDLAVLVDSHAKYRSMAEFIDDAKAHPGKLNIATVSTGSTQNLAASLLNMKAGIDVQIVPFETTSEVLSALRGGSVQAVVEVIPSALGQVSSGALRALAVTSPVRFAGLPQVPTLAESGFPGFDATSWSGLSVPAKTSDTVVSRLAAATATALNDPTVKQKMLMLGADARADTPEQMTRLVQSDTAKWQQVIQQAGIPQR
ncbi:Bug family tripartite tricarboxylate transporter substrate binding protein [Paraburkholderia sp. J7]|uniref:Bug family tripartite tricarboxylate transporter substrate binding protein n=1 Tax=Paraburkholderia sp. J7 TaxID=2805438 RepID=UPI002AB620C4|nr:tripartite tricarboxylate transporter substrate-binding protein [Paraburkholderia sp. J7]